MELFIDFTNDANSRSRCIFKLEDEEHLYKEII